MRKEFRALLFNYRLIRRKIGHYKNKWESINSCFKLINFILSIGVSSSVVFDFTHLGDRIANIVGVICTSILSLSLALHPLLKVDKKIEQTSDYYKMCEVEINNIHDDKPLLQMQNTFEIFIASLPFKLDVMKCVYEEEPVTPRVSIEELDAFQKGLDERIENQ